MDIQLLEQYYKIELPFQPFFYNQQWDKYIRIAGPASMVGLEKLMQAQKHSCKSPYSYLMWMTELKLYMEHKSYYDAYAYFDISTSTANDHFKIFEKHYPLR